jgi:thioredoxin 1
MNSVKHASKQSFTQEVLQSSVPVLVDFYADWCGPCRMLAPALERLAVEFNGRAKIVKVNVDEDPELARQFQVQSIPTLVAIADGKPVGRSSGMASEASLRNALSQLAAASPPKRRVGSP